MKVRGTVGETEGECESDISVFGVLGVRRNEWSVGGCEIDLVGGCEIDLVGGCEIDLDVGQY